MGHSDIRAYLLFIDSTQTPSHMHCDLFGTGLQLRNIYSQCNHQAVMIAQKRIPLSW